MKMICAKCVVLVTFVSSVLMTPILDTSKDRIQDNEVFNESEKEYFRTKKSLNRLEESNERGNVRKFTKLKNFNDSIEDFEGQLLNFDHVKNNSSSEKEFSNQKSSLDQVVDSSEDDLLRSYRQVMSMYPPGPYSMFNPVPMDVRFGNVNEPGANYVQVSPEQINNYIRQGIQGISIKEDLNKKITGQEASAAVEATRNPPVSTPTFHPFIPQQHNPHQPIVVVQPIVVPSHHKEDDHKCPLLALPVIKDKHPHIQIPHLPMAHEQSSSSSPSSILNSQLLSSLLTTLLPALLPLLTKKKEPKQKPVVYMSKQFLINPNVVPSIHVPSIGPHHKELEGVKTEKPTFKEVDEFLEDFMVQNESENATLRRDYLRSAVENEEVHLNNLENGQTTGAIDEYTRKTIPVEYRGMFLKRMAQLDAEVGTVATKLDQLQKQQRMAHFITLNMV